MGGAHDVRPNWSYRLLWWSIVIVSLWMRTGFPIQAIASAGIDDQLFIRQARYLEAGQWLGPFDKLTLVKGMFYPLFVLVSYFFAIPLNIAEQAVYLAASALAGRFALRVTGDRRLALLLFALLALNPVLWNQGMGRVIREGLYLSLSISTVILLVEVAFPVEGESRWRAVARGAFMGLVLGAFWLTREEGLWLLPAIVATILVSVLGVARWGQLAAKLPPPGWLKSVGLPLAVAGATFGCSVGIVLGLNYAKYGVFIANEFKSGPFLRAYGALARIQHDRRRQFVVFPKDAREHAYAVSPAARELAPVLDGPSGENWRQAGCSETNTATCPEILSGWFMWALRDAVAIAGHYTSAPEAMRFYDRLAREINEACAARRIPCGPPRSTMMPVFDWQYLIETARSSKAIGRLMLTIGRQEIGSDPSVGSQSGIAVFADMVGGVNPAHTTEQVFRGWAASPSGRPHVTIRDRADEQVDTTISVHPGPDVGWNATRFDLRTSCPPAVCDLVVVAPGSQEVAFPLDKLARGPATTAGMLQVFLDDVAVRDVSSAGGPRRALQLKIANVIAFSYATVFPGLSTLALAGLVLALARARSRPVPLALVAIAIASAVAVATRIALLAYLDATSMPAQSVLYASPAMPFVMVFSIVGCWCLAQGVAAGSAARRLPDYADQLPG